MAGMLTIMDPAVVGGGIALAMFVGIVLALEAGRWIGRVAITRHGRSGQPNIGSLETAVFALMGLLIAFTFSGALERFDMRRAQVVSEGNAIGTAWLRLDLLPASAQPQMRQAFREYVDSRIATYRALPDVAAAQKEIARSQRLQNRIWAQVVAATLLPEARPNSELLLMPALNDMFDIQSTRIAATFLHPPNVIYGMLICLALVAAVLSGYQSAGEKVHDWIHEIGFAAIMAATIYIILDLEHPRLGWIRIDAIDELLVQLRAGMN
jgi:hypothetical protein